MQLEDMKNILKEGKTLFELPIHFILTTFNGETLYEIFTGKKDIYETIYQSLERHYQLLAADDELDEQY